MRENPLFCVNEEEVKAFRIAREGSSGYLMARLLIDPEVSGSYQAIVLVAEVPAHQPTSIPPHFHQEYEETMYVTAGRGTFRIGHSPEKLRSIPIRPGSCLYIPAGYYHAIAVEGDEGLKFVISYFSTAARGKSHRQIALELTSLPFQGEYGKAEQ